MKRRSSGDLRGNADEELFDTNADPDANTSVVNFSKINVKGQQFATITPVPEPGPPTILALGALLLLGPSHKAVTGLPWCLPIAEDLSLRVHEELRRGCLVGSEAREGC